MCPFIQMSAAVISERKHLRGSAEDELSTSPGSSDNEALASSGDDSPLGSPAQCNTVCPAWLPPGLSLPNECISQIPYSMQIGPPPGLEDILVLPPGLLQPKTSAEKIQKKQPKGNKKGNKPPVNVPSKKPTAPIASCSCTVCDMAVPREFDQALYRKELSDVLRSFSLGGTVSAAVRRIRVQNVPKERQAAEFADILTRAAEDMRGNVRRMSFAFAVALAFGERSSTFDREECERGLEYFFLEVFDDLAAEVPRLRSKIANELVPTLRTAICEETLGKLVPADCRAVSC